MGNGEDDPCRNGFENMADTTQATPPENQQDLSFEDQNQSSADISAESKETISEDIKSEGQTKQEPIQQEKKVSRLEKRLKQLLEKQPPVLQKEALGEDAIEIDESVLQERIQQEVRKAIEMDRAEREYFTSAESHKQDIEQFANANLPKPIEELAVKQYYAINFQKDPFTGKDVFIPVAKFSDIVQEIQEKLAVAAQEYARGNVEFQRRIENQSAISPTATGQNMTSVTPDTTDFKAFEKAFSKR